jgi:tRNA (guanine-N7-)-methyltransferase
MDKIEFAKDLERKRERFELSLKKDEMLSFKKIFGNNNEVRIEIGSGKGDFLAAIAEKLPEVNFIGIDVKEKRIRTMLQKLDLEKHSNVRICRLFVDENVSQIIPKSSIKKIYIIHPDPWPKRRHFRHRIIQNDFLDAVNSVLELDGELRISTDHREYSEWIIKMFFHRMDFVSMYSEGFSLNAPDDHIETYFEKLKKEEGLPPYFLLYKKVKEYDK